MHHEESNGPNMDLRGLNTTSNNADKFSQRRRDHPRGGHDVTTQSYPSNPESIRKQKGKKHRYPKHQQPQTNHQQRQEVPSKQHPGGASKVMNEDEFEVGSVFKSGSKKQNISHLLNFQFEPRSSRKHQELLLRRRNVSGGVKPKYNKEQYLQANCQFVVKASEDYTVHLADPDTPVHWEQIEQVVLKTTSTVPSCPICLYPPKAAKIARCGHVFCWPCILHYLSLSDHSWRKCPICYDAIHRPDLKSVVSITWDEFNVHDEIEFRLMRRDRNSLFALPVEQYFPEVNEKHPSINDKLTSYSQLVMASPTQVARGIISKERLELEEQYRAEKDEPEACFIEEALQYLSQRESGIDIVYDEIIPEDLEADEETENISSDSTSGDTPPIFLEDFKEEDMGAAGAAMILDDSQSRPRHASSSSDGTVESSEVMDANEVGTIAEDEVTADDLDISTIQPALLNKKQNNVKSNNTPKDVFFFYQSSDGQPIYLHALNVQMLVHEYGSLENCPPKIKGKIMEKDSTSMTEELRNRLRYLRHLPLTSIFEVCEIKIKQPLVSKETLDEFEAQLEVRRRKRNRRAREEKRREKMIKAEENKRMGKFPDMKYRIESAFHFPQVGNLTNARSTESLVSVESNLSTSPNLGASIGDSTDGGAFSFARMLREGAAKSSAPATALSFPRSETFPSLSATPKAAKKNEDSEPEPEDYVPPPPKANLGDALAHALSQATISGNGKSKTSNGKKKKMKGQKISLTGSANPMREYGKY